MCQNMKDIEIQLLTLLNSYGDVIELDWEFDADKVIEQLSALPYQESTGNKAGVNLTHSGDQDNLSLRDGNKHDADQQYTDYLTQCTELVPFFDKWEKLARCRAVRLQEGSFFRLHRDAWRLNPQMRIFIPLNKTDISEWAFIYDKELYQFKPGKAYILNTRKQHGSFSFSNDIYHVLLSVYLTENNLKTVQTMLPNCKDH